jgi:glycosyltransferase involved in cell wall biosynthesis
MEEKFIKGLPLSRENAKAVGYVCTLPEEGLAQLEVLKALGCEPYHRVLEIGCGALVAGFPIMQFLDAGNYVGIDPNDWLRGQSLQILEVAKVVDGKLARFHSSDNFVALEVEAFDFILSHSILSHASDVQLGEFLGAAFEQLRPNGILAASIRFAEGNAVGSPGSKLHGADFQEWQYPGVSWFRKADVIERAFKAGLLARNAPELQRVILKGNPKAVHDWIVARPLKKPLKKEPAGRPTSPTPTTPTAPAPKRIMLGVPCFAEGQVLLEFALHSFVEEDVEVVAVDNGASPSTKAALAIFESSISVIRKSQNIYVNPAWNELAERFLASTAEVLVLANADLVVSTGWSKALLLRHDHARGLNRKEFWRGRGVDTIGEVAIHREISGESSTDPRHTAGAFFALPREAVAAAFPIPGLRVWYGDTWIETVLEAAGWSSVTLRDVVARHAGKVSSNQLPEFAAIVQSDREMWEGGLGASAKERGRKSLAASLRLVTAFFRLRDRKIDEAEAWGRFQELVKSEMPITLFLGSGEEPPLLPPTVHVVRLRLEDLAPFRQAAKGLPPARDAEKDTRDFLLLQNAKLDLIAIAADLNPATTHFAWIDFGISKIVKDLDGFRSRLRALPLGPGVRTPGCWTREYTDSSSPDAVQWRFCGGFLLSDRASIPSLVESHHRAFTASPQLTWEVNVWADMEKAGQDFGWYKADHDDSILGAVKESMPRVCLCMIVKNESAIIERCLTSALPFIDTWAICDTGSTDGTSEKIEAFFSSRGISGKLSKTKFEDFSQARNEALQAARSMEGWDYLLLLDADMVLEGRLDRKSLTAHAYRLKQRTFDLEYLNTRFLKRDCLASYAGVTHEYLSVPGAEPPLVDSLLINDLNDGGSKGDKSERDIRLLLGGLTKDPSNGRYMFYLAQTYREVGRHPEAIHWYSRRIEIGGWEEEVWASYYGLCRCYSSLGDEAQLVKAVLDAYNFRPSRAEPLSLLSNYYRLKGKSDASILLAEIVRSIPPSKDLLFVERGVYERKNEVDIAISGFYSKESARREAGYAACARLTIDLNPSIRNEARGNFIHYAKSAKEVFGAEVKEIDWRPTDGCGYAPMNPSILIQGDRRLVLVRTVNYKVADGQYPTVDGSNIIRTRNYVLEFDEAWRRKGDAVFVVDKSGLKRTAFPVEGFEDCRLYSTPEGLRASATVRDLNDGRCEQAILSLDDTFSVTSVDVVRDYEGDKTQKNWMPILSRPGSFLYYCDPTIVIERKDGRTVESSRAIPIAGLVEMRGGSQVIPFKDGWLCIVHEVVFAPSRIYLHRFARLNKNFEIEGVTPPFFFLQKGIEFACGLAQDGDRLVVSFGVQDASAHLAFFDLASIRA